jgi:DNA polymerase-3 subunit epsilon
LDTPAALLRACRLAGPETGHEPNLESSSRRLALPVHTPHHALGDAFTTAQILLALATRLEGTGDVRRPRPRTVGDRYALTRHHRH